MNDQYNLERFVEAQQADIDGVRAELKQGRKVGHWMWYVFPQLKGLGQSSMANHYGISSQAEAKAYLEHPTLGRNLVDCTELVNLVDGRSAENIFGGVDAMKFRSSMTLFAEADPAAPAFSEALDKFFDGKRDPLTLELLGRLK